MDSKGSFHCQNRSAGVRGSPLNYLRGPTHRITKLPGWVFRWFWAPLGRLPTNLRVTKAPTMLMCLGDVQIRPALWTAAPALTSSFLSRSPQAGGKHYHPTCARCVRCHQMFTEGEEMYLTGKKTRPSGSHPCPAMFVKERPSPSFRCYLCFWLVLKTAINSPHSGWFGRVALVANVK